MGVVGRVVLVALAAAAGTSVSATQSSPADTLAASVRFAAGSPAMETAQAVARSVWGVDPCGGHVDVTWGSDDPSVNARSYWSNPHAVYGFADLNQDCRIVLNGALDFSWEKFCTVLVHEYGHLAGWQHGPEGPDVMSPVYHEPIGPCVQTPDPTAPPPLIPAPASAASVTGNPQVSAPEPVARKSRHAHPCPPSQGREPGPDSRAHARPSLQRRPGRLCPARRR
ncbi:MAG TPA: hypothetical protein VFR97_13845 [Capillimicrobium sp.]|nr:hypothetical protein [Capillimicrobium sp.]